MAEATELDQDLVDGLKAAKSKRCYFALVLKGGTDGALVVSKTKVTPNAITAAKKRSKGSAVLMGMVSFKDGQYVFEMAKIPAATAAQAVKTIVKRDTEMTIHAVFQLSQDPEVANLDRKPEDGKGQTRQAKEEPPKKSSVPGPLPEAQKYSAALQEWEQVSAAALSSTEKLITALEATGDELAEAIAAVVEDLNANFPDTLTDALTGLAQAANNGNSGDTELYRNKSEIAIKAALAYLNNNAKTIDGCEQNPFGISVSFRAPLTESLKKVLTNVKK